MVLSLTCTQAPVHMSLAFICTVVSALCTAPSVCALTAADMHCITTLTERKVGIHQLQGPACIRGFHLQSDTYHMLHAPSCKPRADTHLVQQLRRWHAVGEMPCSQGLSCMHAQQHALQMSPCSRVHLGWRLGLSSTSANPHGKACSDDLVSVYGLSLPFDRQAALEHCA